MAINIQNIIAALEAKVAAATSATETQELIVIIKSIKAAGQQTIVTYADVPNLPTASADNAGNLGYVAAVGKIYYSNGTTWTEVGSGSGGGGGTAYDQSLNTTDDVVFNSALVGDVSIVGNEISGTDSYGNNTALVVSSEMQVNVGSISTFNGNSSNNSITLQLYSYDVSFFISGAGYYFNEDFVRALYNNDPNSSPVVSVTFPGAIGMSDTVVTGRLKANGGGNAGEWVYGNTNPATIQNIYFDTNYINEITVDGIPVTSHPNYNNSFIIGQQVTFTTGSQTTPLSVTATGVNVDGTFTINGQPVSGGSGFDGGSLVATDALIGDVSIVGNEISGVDAYGNDATLIVIAPVDFNFTGTTTSIVQTLLSMNGVGFQQSSMNGFQIYSLNGSFQSEANQILNLPQGTIITTGDMLSYSTYQNVRFRFAINTVMSTPDMYNPSVISAIYMYPIADQFEYSTDGGQTWTTTNTYSYNFNNGFVNLYLSFEAQSVVNSIETAVSVTESGLNVNGSFTVNGQAVANYDQSLNTTDDVVFNSALIGDVSIIGNEISGLDAYGNDATLVLNSSVDFKVTETTNSETIIDFGASTSIVPTFDFGTYAQYISLRASSGFGPTPLQQLLAIPSGTLVTTNVFSSFNFMTYQTDNKFFRFVVDGTPTALYTNPYDPSLVTEIRYNVVSGTLESSTDGINWNGQAYDNVNYQTNSNGIITYGGTTTVENTVVSVTSTGLIVNGNLTLAETTEAPASATSPVRFAKVIVAGQTYYMPLFQ